jgi:hypothetical protein
MKKTKELINLDSVKENIDLKKFIKILDKKKITSGNVKEIYQDFLNSCINKKTDNSLRLAIVDLERNEEFFEVYFTSGAFMGYISKNFTLKKKFRVNGKEWTDMKQEYYIHQIVSSKINKCFYVLVYQGFDTTNDGYYCRDRFDSEKLAANFIKKEQKNLKVEMLQNWIDAHLD